MTLKQRYDGVIEWFSANMPSAESELHYENPYQLLVAVMLSAQCTDKRVNMTTPALFAAYPTPQALAAATAEEIYPYIRSISYPNNKARSLAAMARMLCTEFGGEVPSDLEALQRLPGVGRKTANVVGAVIWHKEVMPVDTHVFRVSARIGLTRGARTPLQTELQLEKNIPHHLLPVGQGLGGEDDFFQPVVVGHGLAGDKTVFLHLLEQLGGGGGTDAVFLLHVLLKYIPGLSQQKVEGFALGAAEITPGGQSIQPSAKLVGYAIDRTSRTALQHRVIPFQ